MADKAMALETRGTCAAETPPMDRLLSTLVREPVTCLPDASIASVLQTMHRYAIGSIVVVDQEQRPIGIFTLHDLLSRVALPQRNLTEPIAQVMTRDLTTLPPKATAYEAALAMVRHGIRHVLVVDSGRLIGVISEKDLFSLQRVSMRQLSQDIKNADSLESLKQFSAEVRTLAQSMLVQGVAAEQLTQFIASLNDLLTQRLIDLEFRQEELGAIRLCWLALGSEGRLEQTLSTDQDNGIIFEPPAGTTPEAVRERLLPIAKRINLALDACGFPLCKGDIMASNPQWCLSAAEWRAKFAAWIDSGSPEALLHGSIFFDFRPLHGESRLAAELRAWLMSRVCTNRRFLHQMAENALRNRPPLGFFRDFALDGSGEHRDTIDLKLNGATLFVDAARILSLQTGVPATNTAQRLRLSADKMGIDRDEVESWIEAFYFIQRLRLRNQHQQNLHGKPMGNRINPYALNRLERHILKEAFRQAKALQARLALDYQVAGSG
ncbi:putative nucleotidyltransferase substrate binding domain-containing protein [Pelomicrobium methylotrophicum]|nr:putative nucleotidyltransferase substrate binding domain-containing protein [Pelomicrobium methylotrophicum]